MTGVPALERAIGRAAARRADVVERCGLCAGPVAEPHRHVLDEREGGVLCACTPCSLLFDREAAGGDHYRLIPSGRTRLDGIVPQPLDTQALDVPVGLAFFVKQGDGAVLAHYPSPFGTTGADVDAESWSALEDQFPALAQMRPRVEALLVRTSGRPGRDEHWILPVDDCFRLVAVIRRHWEGMAGGSAVWREVARFFDDLGGRAGRGSDSRH